MAKSLTRKAKTADSAAPTESAAALFPGEKLDDYQALFARVVSAVAPQDGLEEFWVEDVAILTWEMQRLRRIKAGIVKAAMPAAVKSLLLAGGEVAGVNGFEVDALAKEWSIHEASARQRVDALLASMQLTMDDVAALATQRRLREVEKLNTMIMQAEARRNVALREINRRRDLLASRLRAAAAIEDAEFEEVQENEAREPKSVPGGKR